MLDRMSEQPIITLAGLFHETNTFAEGLSKLSDFSLMQGEELLAERGNVSPLGGFFEVADAHACELRPVIDLRAIPGPMVADEVVEYFLKHLLGDLRACRPDALFMVLHGAMVCESEDDVEGHVLSKIREEMGSGFPIFGVYDLHANVSEKMTQSASGLIAYRENPHRDAFAAAKDAALLMFDSLESNKPCHMALRSVPVLLTPIQTGTDDLPMSAMEAEARVLENEFPGIAALNINAGFAYADTADTSLSFSAVVWADGTAEDAFDALEAVLGRVGLPESDPPQTIQDALSEVSDTSPEMTLLVEDADNIGGGASGKSTTLLRELIAADCHSAAVAICDPELVESLESTSIGQCASVVFSGLGGRFHEDPLRVKAVLIARSSGHFDLEDIHSHLASACGRSYEMGPSVVLQIGGIEVLVTSRKTPPMDLGMWHSQGIEIESKRIVGIKAAVSHRQAFAGIATKELHIDTPGPCSNVLSQFEYKKVRRPVFPLDPDAYTVRTGQTESV